LVSTVVGGVCLLATFLALPFLSAGDPGLGRLLLIGVALAIPALVVGVFRGAATGRQMWGAVAAERYVNIATRIVALGLLLALGRLTVVAALLVTAVAPVVAGIVYWRLFLPPPRSQGVDEERLDGSTLRLIVSYGNRVWLGSVASMLLSRLAQLLMVPLSSAEDLGLYSVATAVSDVPLIVALAVAGALFGVNSAARDAAQIALTSRLTLLVSVAGCGVLAVTSPWWIAPLFGPEFRAAVVPTLMLLFSAVLCVPGLMAATGIGAWGRPGLRSLGLVITLAANLGTFVLLVPRTGVIGACWTSIVSNIVMSGYMVVVAARVMRMPIGDFVVIRGADVARAWHEGVRLLSRLRPRRHDVLTRDSRGRQARRPPIGPTQE
jgi:O-antigen/teichoic acid export membrane protein